MPARACETGRAYDNDATGAFGAPEAPGISGLYRDDAGAIYHTYSAYARGLDIVNGAHHVLDLVPKGRDEGGLSYPMDWVQRHDADQAPPPVIIAKGLSKRPCPAPRRPGAAGVPRATGS